MQLKSIVSIILFFLVAQIAFSSGVSEAQINYPELFVSETQLQEQAKNISPNFKYISKDGSIHSSYTGNKDTLQQLFSPDIEFIKSDDFYSKSFSIIEIDKGQIPVITLKDNAFWNNTNNIDFEKTMQGNNFSALGFQTKNVVYYRYEGINPLFEKENPYNAMSYIDTTNTTKNVLDRFLFFRWTGKNMGIDLNTYMYAIDTYTGLVFAYVKIGTWNTAFGVEIPVKYDPIDIYKSQDGTARFFFEYDPIGYVCKNGDIVLHDWYTDKTREKLDVQLLAHLPLGKSPYYTP